MVQQAPGTKVAVRARELLSDKPELLTRFTVLQRLAISVRPSEFHVTNACNIRCKGCWFFEFGHDRASREVKDLDRLDQFLAHQKSARKVNAALVIGGEPSLVPDRLKVFKKHFRYLTISTNGLKPLPHEEFEDVAIGITLFGGGPVDDELRGIRPNGQRFSGLFEKALANYRDDPRAGFIYALTGGSADYIESTVRRIKDNGNRVQFNYYRSYDVPSHNLPTSTASLLAEAIRVKNLYPETVVSHPYYIRALLTGSSHFGDFGYDVCPSVSVDHPAHAARADNGNPHLTFFNSYAADLSTLNFCCTSGHCDECRDSQAVMSWLLVSLRYFIGDAQQLQTWIEIAESYWRQFIWGPLHWTKDGKRSLPPPNVRPIEPAASSVPIVN